MTELSRDQLLEQARVLEEAREYGLARSLYRRLLEEGTDRADILSRMAETFTKEEKLSTAVRYLEEAVSYEPAFPSMMRLSQCLTRLSEHARAGKLLERMLLMRHLSLQERVEIHHACGNQYVRLRQPDRARRHFEAGLALAPAAPDLMQNLGALALDQGDWLEAERCFKAVLEVKPMSPYAKTGLAAVYFSKTDMHASFEACLEALTWNPKEALALYFLIRACYPLKRFKEASEKLERYIESNQPHADLHYALAGLYFHNQEPQKCMDALKEALLIDPDHKRSQALKSTLETLTADESRRTHGRIDLLANR
jgi:tetratricopeptide (TPR) repeat protein